MGEPSNNLEVLKDISDKRSGVIDSPYRAIRAPTNTLNIDQRERNIAHDNEDIEMEDISMRNRRGKDEKGRSTDIPETVDQNKLRAGEQPPKEYSRNVAVRRTELAAATNPRDVLNKILGTKVELTAGEILGNSRELTQVLADQIRFRQVTSAKSTLQAYHVGTSRDHGPLLTVPVRIADKVYSAVVDSGSEVNIITRELWEKLQVPMDINASLTLRDANGGNGKLKGLIPNLPIQIGGLTTHSNFWVSTDCPLDILLGRPWQHHNFVLIDERLDGTYLRFSYVKWKR